MNRASITAAAAACILLAVSPAFAATAANSQNGTDSSNPEATQSAPTSTSAVPATKMPMGMTAEPNAPGTGSTAGSGAGGNAGTINPFAFVAELRAFWDGCVALSGAITNGRAVRAAEIMGADLAYMGTRFIATDESLAAPAYKQMLLESQASDILYTNAFSGIRGSVLRASIVAAGHDPDALPERTTIDLAAHLDVDVRSRSGIWSAGHGVGDITDIVPVAGLVDRLEAQYRAACVLP